MITNKMQVEIWSDVMCPFCYIGKRRLEKAIEQLSDKNAIEIIWKSYQLAPGLKTDPSININQYLADHKRMSIEQAMQINDHVSQMASKEGLTFNFDQAIVANTFNAHRLIHFAKSQDKQDLAEEKLFHAYFTEGKNLDDLNTLLTIGEEIGLDTVSLKLVLDSEKYSEEVRADIAEAEKLAVRGVPFFVFDRKYAISGAQESGALLQILEKSIMEWKELNTSNLQVVDVPSCAPDGTCD